MQLALCDEGYVSGVQNYINTCRFSNNEILPREMH